MQTLTPSAAGLADRPLSRDGLGPRARERCGGGGLGRKAPGGERAGHRDSSARRRASPAASAAARARARALVAWDGEQVRLDEVRRGERRALGQRGCGHRVGPVARDAAIGGERSEGGYVGGRLGDRERQLGGAVERAGEATRRVRGRSPGASSWSSTAAKASASVRASGREAAAEPECLCRDAGALRPVAWSRAPPSRRGSPRAPPRSPRRRPPAGTGPGASIASWNAPSAEREEVGLRGSARADAHRARRRRSDSTTAGRGSTPAASSAASRSASTCARKAASASARATSPSSCCPRERELLRRLHPAPRGGRKERQELGQAFFVVVAHRVTCSLDAAGASGLPSNTSRSRRQAARDPARDRPAGQPELVADRAIALVAAEEAVEDLLAVGGERRRARRAP